MQSTPEEREEDSGLHDIRNLAQSTKQRLSKRSITAQPIADDVLASSSGAFKNIALPQPAKMVSLPSVEELPSKADVAAAEKAAKRAARESAKELKKAEAAPAAASLAAVPSAAIDTPAASASLPARSAFTLPSQQRKSSKGPVLAILGLGMAAAAGGVLYMQMDKKSESASGMAVSEPAAQAPAADMDKNVPTGAASAGSAAMEVTAQPAAVAAIPAEAPAPEPAKAAADGAAQLATDNVEQAETKADDKSRNKKKPGKGKRVEKEEAPPPKVEEKKPVEKVEVKKPDGSAAKGGGEGEPSFDALLKEAGVSDQKKDTKPKLEKKSLSGDDFKKGIGGVAGKAKGCYKGTQGTVSVKLVIAPSGSISKVTVAGDFAGKPEGTCVENALKGASFPPWDGGPQTFNYSVLLSD